MVKKGKFKLLSYVIEDQLIFYKSLNKNKKILAFSIIETESFFPLLQILSDFLRKRFIKYFSIQLKIHEENKKIFLLNFEEINKNEINKLYNLVYQKVNNNKNQLTFLKKASLEKMFLNIFNKKDTSNLSISKSQDSILIKNHKFSTIYNFYTLNLNRVQTKSSFIHNFVNLASSFNINGYLIFNFRPNLDNTINIAPYFVEFNNNINPNENIDHKINDFYNYELLLKQKLELARFFNFLWRFDIFNNNISFNDFSELFIESSEQYDFHDLIKFNSQFETNLLKQKLRFKRLNRNLIIIEQNVLFYSASILDSKLILKILKRYYSKFNIFLLILNDSEYDKLLKINKIDLLNNVEVLDSDKFTKLDFKVFKDLSLKKA